MATLQDLKNQLRIAMYGASTLSTEFKYELEKVVTTQSRKNNLIVFLKKEIKDVLLKDEFGDEIQYAFKHPVKAGEKLIKKLEATPVGPHRYRLRVLDVFTKLNKIRKTGRAAPVIVALLVMATFGVSQKSN